jgi:thiol-disulfide isomerase/thioredoxin
MLLFENWGEATNPASPVFPDRPQGAPMTPQGGFDLRPDPKPLSVDENGQPPSPASDLPPPAFSTPSQPRRPELTTTIPTPTIIPPPPLEGNRRESRSVRFEFGLLDTLGRPRVFPTGRSQDLILLDFMTTTCVPCKKTIPLLKDLQARYGSQNLEVIGVCCDDVEMPQRRAVAAQYERTQDLNYLLYIEPGKKPGNVMDRFQVEAFPTLVLLNGDGNLLWQGDSRKIRQLEAVIRQQLEDNPSPDADRPPPPPAVR